VSLWVKVKTHKVDIQKLGMSVLNCFTVFLLYNSIKQE